MDDFWFDVNTGVYDNNLPSGTKAFVEHQHALERRFKQALAEEFGVVGHPKFEKAYAIAYEKGHSNGYSEIALEFSELVELIKD